MTVVDLSMERSADAVFAASVIQGIVNRVSPGKIFLGYRIVDPSHPDTDPLEAWLEDGLIPYPVRRAELNASSEFPALEYLLRNYGHFLRGMVLSPRKERGCEGAIAASVTACAFEDAIPVSDGLRAFVGEVLPGLNAAADVRGMENIEALRHTVSRYGRRPDRCRKLMGFTHGGRPSFMVDYWVAVRALCFYLDAMIAEEALAFEEILNSEIIPEGAIIYGDVEGTFARRMTQMLGYTVSAGDLCNLSVTSSVPPSGGAALRRPPAPAAVEAEPDAAYVAWNMLDGDCPVGVGVYGYLALREAPRIVPSGMWFHPHMIDLFPAMAEWWSRRMAGTADVIASMNDGGVAPWTESGRSAWRESYRSVISRSNGLFGAFNVFYENEDTVNEVLSGPLGWRFVILGYNCEHYLHAEGPSRWRQVGGCVYCSQGCMSDADSIRAAAADVPEGKPAFIMARRHGPHGRFMDEVAEAMADLISNPPAGRKVVFLRPSDLAETWAAWNRAHGGGEAVCVWPGPLGERFRPVPDRVVRETRISPCRTVPCRVVLPCGCSEEDFGEAVKRARSSGSVPSGAVWELSPDDAEYGGGALHFGEKVRLLRRIVSGPEGWAAGVRMRTASGREEQKRMFLFIGALEAASCEGIDAFIADGESSAEALRRQMRIFPAFGNAAVLMADGCPAVCV